MLGYLRLVAAHFPFLSITLRLALWLSEIGARCPASQRQLGDHPNEVSAHSALAYKPAHVLSPTSASRYVEWTPADEPSRRRGRLVVQSERNIDFLKRMKERQLRCTSQNNESVAFAEMLLSENFLFSQVRA